MLVLLQKKKLQFIFMTFKIMNLNIFFLVKKSIKIKLKISVERMFIGYFKIHYIVKNRAILLIYLINMST